jgi:hypothetical protein
MTSTYTARAGITEPLVMRLVSIDAQTGAETPYDLTGHTPVVMHVRTRTGTVRTYSTADAPAKLAVTDALAGEVTFSPATTDLVAADQILAVYFVATRTADGKTIGFPNDAEGAITVRAAFA